MRKIKSVLLVGGTHGNEKTGVYLVNQYWKTNSLFDHLPFKVEGIIGNPQATKLCRRYIDQDLNRSFSRQELNNDSLANYENKRAKEINNQYGNDQNFVIDLHTTTSNMGRTIVILHNSLLSNSVVYYLQRKHPDIKVIKTSDYNKAGNFLNQISKEGFLIEIGPVPQGVIHSKIVNATHELVSSTLEILQSLQDGGLHIPRESLQTYTIIENIDFPRDENGEVCATIHPERESKDFNEIKDGDPLFLKANGDIIYYQGENCFPIFMNEAAYYEKGIAMQLTQIEELPLSNK